MRGFLVIPAVFIVQTHAFFGWNYRSRLVAQTELPADWEASWKQVGSPVETVPSHKLVVEWPNNVNVQPNDTVDVGWMGKRPSLYWPSESGELYTVMIFDAGIKQIQPKGYIHWMVTNIPGTHVKRGNEVMEYVTPFSIELNEDGSIIKDATHTMLIMVFKQPEKIVTDETQFGCSPDLFPSRTHEFMDLPNKYGLELVAGNYLQAPYSGYYTQQMLCRFSKCMKYPLPQLLPGVNDGEECQPRTDIIDMTIMGPKLAKRKEYAKYRSTLSPDSIPTLIRDTYPVLSTGKIKGFTSIQGAYDQANNPGAYIGTNNQEDILEGVVDTTFLNYPSKEAAAELFKGAGVPGSPIEAMFPYMANEKSLKVILSQPYNQDFDFETVIAKPGMVFDLNIVKRKEGDAGKDFIKLRKHLISLLRSNKHVVSYQKFIVDQEILEAEKGGPLYFDSSDNFISLITFKSMAARSRAYVDIRGNNLDFFEEFNTTFECIVCATLTDELHESNNPPFVDI